MGKGIPCSANSTCKGTELHKSLVHLGMVSNSLWPKSSVCAKVGRDETEEASKARS